MQKKKKKKKHTYMEVYHMHKVLFESTFKPVVKCKRVVLVRVQWENVVDLAVRKWDTL